MRPNTLTAIFSILLFLSAHNLNAGQGDPETEIFILQSDKYKIEINTKYSYTIRRICFENYEAGKNTGFYGAVIAPESGTYIGAGHTEGGIEKIQSTSLFVNDQQTNIENGRTYNGELLRFEKVSRLDNLLFTTTIKVSSSGITESKFFEAVEDQKINCVYAFLYCLNVNTTEWLAETTNDLSEKGIFKNDGSWHLQKDIKWVAVYDQNANKGILIYFPIVIKGQSRKSAIWDIAEAYHKYYLMLDVPNLIKKGFKSKEMVLEFSCFSAEKTDWKTIVKKNIEALKNK